MTELLLHPDTERQMDQLAARPAHAVLFVAPNGTGKRTVARYLAAQLLAVTPEKLDSHPYFKQLQAPAGKAISIELVRDVVHFLMLRTTSATSTSRVVLIEDAGRMTQQAQNALLKTIEEPPSGTVLILTAANELDILPTIRSRTQQLTIKPPSKVALQHYFTQVGYPTAAVDKALGMSDGLPGLTMALLADDASHPLVAAATRARDLLQKPIFERLLLIDALTKQKQEWLDTLFIVQRIAEISLRKPELPASSMRKWHAVLTASHEAHKQALTSAQVKLVALQFMLSI